MILLPLIAVLAACWPTFVALHFQWTDWAATTWTHGYLLALACAWLLWRDRQAIGNLPASPRAGFVLPFLGAAVAWLFAVLSGVQTVEFILLPLLMWLAVLATLGWRVAQRTMFPFAYLYFAIPVWGSINGVFQWTSVYAVRFALRLVGIPAYFEANHVQIPSGTFEIAGGCSGLHFFLVAMAIAALMGELRNDTWRGRLKLLVIAAALSMLTNWIRIFSIIVVGHVTHMQHYLVARSHYGYGWALFAVAMVVFYFIESRMPAPTSAKPDVVASRASAVRAGLMARAPWLAAVLVLVAVLGVRLLVARPAPAVVAAPASVAGWTLAALQPQGWRPHFEGIDAEQLVRYERPDGAAFDRYIGAFRGQRQNKEFSGYNNDLFHGLTVGPANRLQVGVRSYTAYHVQDRKGAKGLLAVTYSVADRFFATPLSAQLHYAGRSMQRLRAAESHVEVVRVDCLPDCVAAESVLKQLED
jgi:exosortase A